MVHLKNRADTEDIFQTVFLKYVLSSVSFESEEHEKAWIIRVTINACKDLLKSFYRRRTVSLDAVIEQPALLPPDNKRCWKRFYPFRPNIRTWFISTFTRIIPPPRSARYWARTSIRFIPSSLAPNRC